MSVFRKKEKKKGGNASFLDMTKQKQKYINLTPKYVPTISSYLLSFQMFEELHNTGKTSFTMKLSHSCDTCFNVRLLKVRMLYWNGVSILLACCT